MPLHIRTYLMTKASILTGLDDLRNLIQNENHLLFEELCNEGALFRPGEKKYNDTSSKKFYKPQNQKKNFRKPQKYQNYHNYKSHYQPQEYVPQYSYRPSYPKPFEEQQTSHMNYRPHSEQRLIRHEYSQPSRQSHNQPWRNRGQNQNPPWESKPFKPDSQNTVSMRTVNAFRQPRQPVYHVEDSPDPRDREIEELRERVKQLTLDKLAFFREWPSLGQTTTELELQANCSQLPYVMIDHANRKWLIDTGSRKNYICEKIIPDNIIRHKEKFSVKTAAGTREGTDVIFTNLGTTFLQFPHPFRNFMFLTYVFDEMDTFDMSHSFVRNHPQYYKYLRELFVKLKLQALSRNHYIAPLVMFEQEWCRKVYDWFYSFVSTKYYFKKKHIYLYGDSNIGKSYFVRHLVGHLGGYIFYPSRQFPFGSLDVYHKVIVWDEFSFDDINHDYLKLVLSGETFPINQKYIPERLFNVNIPIIMLSNHLPLYDDWFQNRCIIVHCDVSLQGDLPDIHIEVIDGFIGRRY